MKLNLEKKCQVADIQRRFDNDVERFSNLSTGQSSTIDAALAMELITNAAFGASSPIVNLLDIGCGAGNNTLKLLELSPNTNCDLLDLSLPMLNRAKERVTPQTSGHVEVIQGDFREVNLQKNHYDVIIGAAVFHHLRDEEDWLRAFQKIYDLLKVGGSIWITDLVIHDNPAIFELMWGRYRDYLTELGGVEYAQKVFDYIDFEDSPRSLTFQLDMLKKVGFTQLEILHKNSCFAAFGAIKSSN